MALCSCSSVDVVSILQKKREPLTSLTCIGRPLNRLLHRHVSLQGSC